MTIAEMSTYFDLIQDKYGSPYFTNSEKTLFLQRAHVEFVKEFLPTEEDKDKNIELNQDAITSLAPLIFSLGYLNMNSSGVVLKSSVQAGLTSLSATGLLWRPLNVGLVLGGKTLPVKYTRHNQWFELYNNYFKKPSTESYRMYETATGYTIAPINTNAKLYFTVLKYPEKVDIGLGTNSDLPDFTHDRIVAIALELAGIGSRDANLMQLIQLKSQNAK